MPELIEVRVEQDHLRGLIGSQPLKAVSELIWNAVDADADTVSVKVLKSALGGIEEVRVEDNGHGMTFQEAKEEFSHLGGSWKQLSKRSRGQRRFLHGSKGQGRWRAYAIGGRVRWVSVANDGELAHRTSVTILGERESLGHFSVSDPEPVDQETGTTVILDCVMQHPRGLSVDNAAKKLTAEFATYLEENSVAITYHGTLLNPSGLKRHEKTYRIEVPDAASQTARLTVIEWDTSVDRALYLCDENGTPLERQRAGVHAPGFEFTAYLKWEGFRKHEHELSLADGGIPVLSDLIEVSREKLREHFRSRTSEITKAVISQWKDEEVYPYSETPSTTLEKAENDLFDVVAIATAQTVNRNRDQVSKRLTLQLMKEALNHSPRSLRRVLKQVLDLPDTRSPNWINCCIELAWPQSLVLPRV